MALASQTARLHGRGRLMTNSRRRRPGKLPVIGGALGLALVLGLSWWWLSGGSPQSASADEPPSGGAEPAQRSADARSAPGSGQRDPLAATFAELPSGPTTGATGDAGRGSTAADASRARPQTTPPQAPPSQPLSVIEMGARPAPAQPQAPSASPAASTATLPSTRPTPAEPTPASPGNAPASPTTATPASGVAPAGDPANTPAAAPAPAGLTGAAILEADGLLAANKPVEARSALQRALASSGASESDRAALRDRIGRINENVIFSPTLHANDPFTFEYRVQPGDSLARIASQQKLGVDWRLIARVNRISDPRRISVGQRLKLVRGPFHAVVDKSDYRLDLYAGDPASEGSRTFIRSFRVGLGENDSTPIGSFIVRPQSKLINPVWTNPRTGEHFAADNPLNPIGEHWVGLDPADAATAQFTQYGLHGTIEPESIGQQRSMGCVRLAPDDIALVYELMAERLSTVRVQP